MKKYIIPIIGSLLLISCQKEVLAPEQMIQGKFALDDGTALTSSYLVFDKGHLSTYISESDRPFAEGKIWRADGDLFQLSSAVSYSITDGVLNASSTSAPIELKDGILTIGETKYSLLEGLEHEPYSTIVTDREQVFSYTVQDITIPFTVDCPLPNSNLSCSTNTSWITGLAVQEGVIIAHLSSTSTDRDGAISLSYPFADPVVVSIKRRPSTFICLEEDRRTVDYTAQRVVLPYTIDNPVSGSSLTASVDASWINNIQVSDNEVSFNVTENNTFGSRSAAIALSYKGAPDVTFYVTQEYSAPVITLTPSSQTVNYAGGTFSFDYTITNPREGMTVTAVSQATWITDVTVSGTTVSYSISSNNSNSERSGVLRITYGTLVTFDYPIVEGGMPVTSLTLNKNNLSLSPKTYENLIATVVPSDAELTWFSNNPAVATVTLDGKVSAIGNGIANITVSSMDGHKTTNCTVNVSGYPDLIDLGLSVKWGSCNIGATSMEEYGDYFAWGDKVPYYVKGHSQDKPCQTWIAGKTGYNWPSYRFRVSGGYSYDDTWLAVKFSKYNKDDNKTELDPNDDVARDLLGGGWRMPTIEECRELFNNCNREQMTINGIEGYKFTSKKKGYVGNWIFLPAAGYRADIYLREDGTNGFYWSSSLELVYYSSHNACYLGFSGTDSHHRCAGHSVRPVCD